MTEPIDQRPAPADPDQHFVMQLRADAGARFISSHHPAPGIPTKYEWRLVLKQRGLPDHEEPWAPLAPDIVTREQAMAVARTLSVLVISRLQGATVEALPGDAPPGGWPTVPGDRPPWRQPFGGDGSPKPEDPPAESGQV